jgi:rpsE_bact: ribosomal protein S5
MQLKISSL